MIAGLSLYMSLLRPLSYSLSHLATMASLVPRAVYRSCRLLVGGQINLAFLCLNDISTSLRSSALAMLAIAVGSCRPNVQATCAARSALTAAIVSVAQSTSRGRPEELGTTELTSIQTLCEGMSVFKGRHLL